MNSHERIILFGALLAVGAWNIALHAGLAGRTAHADLAMEPADLGPADRVILAAEDANLELRSAGGRLAWGEDESSRAYSVAYMHIGRALEQMMDSQQFVDERTDFDEEFEAKFTELRDRFEAWQDRNPNASPDQPPPPEAQQEFRELMQANQQLEQDRMTRSGQLLAQQVERAYREVVTAVNVVADRRKIDIVYRFIPTENEFQAQTPDQAYLAISSRTILRSPEKLDITDAVMEELALETD